MTSKKAGFNLACMPKILIVDDDIHSVEVISYLFEQEGFSCVTVLNYKDACNQLSENLFDLAIIDLRMPGIDGYQLIEDVRKKHSFPIIAFTALDDLEVHQKALAKGASCVVTKPCSPSNLLDLVKNLLAEKS